MSASSPATPPDGPDVDAVAAAVRACPSVADLSGGRLGEVATYLPGRQVAGIRLLDDAVDVHVIGHYGPSVDTIAGEVRTAVAPLVGRRPVSVSVDDLDTGLVEAGLASEPSPAAGS